MIKYGLCSVLIIILLMFSGCSDDKRIDKALLAETVSVSVDKQNFEYTFYMLGSEDKVKSVSIKANSFSQAYFRAKEKYIPNLSLAKLELFIFDEKISYDKLKSDVEYVAHSDSISPLAMITLADGKAIKYVNETKEAPENIKQLIFQIKKKLPKLRNNILSIFNNFNRRTSEIFCVPYINSDKELNVDFRIFSSNK